MKAGKSCGSPPGSSHSPQWKPVSQRYRSCGGGLGAAGDPVGVPVLAGHPLDPVEPRHHHRPALLQQREVAVLLVDLPRHQDRGVAPARGAVRGPQEAAALGDRHRRHAGEGAVLPLAGGEVAEPLRGEAGHVVEERRGRHVELPVAGPAGALAGGAVGGDVAGVGAEAPHRGGVQPVDPVVVAAEAPAHGQVGVHDDAGDVVRAERAGVALDPDVLEAVGGEPRVEHVALAAGRDHGVDLAGAERLGQERHRRPQVLHGHVAVRAQRLAVGERDLGARVAEVRQPDPAVDVLAEVDEVHAGTQLGDRDRADLLHRPHRRGRRADQRVVPALADGDRLPVRGVVPRRGPALLQQPAVLALSLDQVGGQDVRVGPAPGGVGAEDGGGAVVVLEVQLGEERGLLAPLVGGAQDPDLAAVPPVGEQRAEHVRFPGREGR